MMANIQKTKKANIMEELTKIVENGQILGITHQQLAEKFNTRRQTISTYLEKVYSTIPAEDINSTRVKLQVMFDKLFREAQKMIQTASNSKERKDAMDLLLRCMDRFTVFLEAFGLKAKAQENINIQGDIKQTNMVININANSNMINSLSKHLEGKIEDKDRQAILIDVMEENKLNDSPKN